MTTTATTSKTYAAVAAVRIQSWLARTPALRLLRGGSALLREATSAPAITEVIDGELTANAGVRVDKSAGDVDGVVALEIDSGNDPERVVHTIAQHLRTRLPGLEWSCWWVTADNYLAAFRIARDESNPQVGRARFLPIPLEAPSASVCTGCGGEPSGGYCHKVGNGENAETVGPLGTDCENRWTAARPAFTESVPGAPRLPKDFDELAAEGGRIDNERRDQRYAEHRVLRNRLATICADGNRIGDVFDLLADSNDAALRQVCVEALNTSLRMALDSATTLVSADAPVAGCIEHYVGGDDLFVSVPAPLTTPFTRQLLDAFAAQLQSSAKDLNGEIAKRFSAISLAVGVGFADARYPVAVAREHAEHALHEAKRLANGKQSGISWIDLTAESTLPATRWLSKDQLDEIVDEKGLWCVVDLPASARAVLYEYVRRDPGEHFVAEIEQWCKRTSRDDLLTYLSTRAPHVDTLVLRGELEAALSLSRWWIP